jgi:hypothetical protein
MEGEVETYVLNSHCKTVTPIQNELIIRYNNSNKSNNTQAKKEATSNKAETRKCSDR